MKRNFGKIGEDSSLITPFHLILQKVIDERLKKLEEKTEPDRKFKLIKGGLSV